MKNLILSVIIVVLAASTAEAGLFRRRCCRPCGCANSSTISNSSRQAPSRCYTLPNGVRVCPVK